MTEAETGISPTALLMMDYFGTICTIVAIGISGQQIFCHLRHLNEPKVQLQVIRILFIVPVSTPTLISNFFPCQVFSLATWLSLLYPTHLLAFATLRDIYEAYVLYIFMQFLVDLLGGESQIIRHLEFKRRLS